MTDRSEEVLTGEYFSMRPDLPTIAGIRFHYDILDEPDKSYSKLLDTITAPLKTMTIKTNDMCGFNVNGYVKGQDGGLWQVSSVIETLVNGNDKQALRRRKKTIQTLYIVRLIGVENPWEI